jgi:hypothetical protein
MSSQPPPKKPPPPGSIDFEITDFDEARRALDELPAGVEQVHQLLASGGEWEARRRKPLPSDRALTGEAMDWVVSLPTGLRPHSACEQFPRVVNAVASSWGDHAFSLQVLDHMINDYRGGRRGFPPSVQQELAALLAHQKARSPGR